MAFVLIIFGVILFVAAYNGNVGQFGTMLRDDIVGSQGNHGFLFWLVAIIIVGGIGYLRPLKGLSDAFIALLLLVLFIGAGKNGFFSKFNQALSNIGSGAQAGNVSVSITGITTPNGQTIDGLNSQAQGYVAGGAPGL